MPVMSDYLQTSLRNHVYRAATFAKTTTRYVSLHTADPAGTGASEVTGGSYARVQRDALDANWSGVSATDGVTQNVAVITFAAPTANWGVVTHVGLWEASTAGNFFCSAPLGTAKTVNSGDAAPSLAALAVTFTFAGNMSDFLQTQCRGQLFRTLTFAKPGAGGTARYVSLHTADPAGTGASEVTGGSYARAQKDASDTNWTGVLTTDGITANGGTAIAWPAPTANWGTVTHFGVWDALTSGNFLNGGPLGASKIINSGDGAPSAAAGALVITFS